MSTLAVDTITSKAGKPLVNSTGSVLQVVSTVQTSQFTSTTSDLAAPTDCMSATIVPSAESSKILITVNASLGGSANAIGVNTFLKKNGSLLDVGSGQLGLLNYGLGRSDGNNINYSMTFLDSPNTVTSTIYTFAIGRYGGSGTAYFRWNINKDICTITLMEIAG